MEQERQQFSPELLRQMRDEQRENFLTALKTGASWGQLYQIRTTIKKLNSLIDEAEASGSATPNGPTGRGDDGGPRPTS